MHTPVDVVYRGSIESLHGELFVARHSGEFGRFHLTPIRPALRQTGLVLDNVRRESFGRRLDLVGASGDTDRLLGEFWD